MSRLGEGGVRRGKGQSCRPLGTPLCPQDSLGCRLVFLLMQYCVAANYYWLLVEGVYLYTLLALSVFSEQRVFRLYLTIGWGKAHHHASPPTTPTCGVGGWETLAPPPTAAFRLPPHEANLALRTQGWAQGQGPLDSSLLGTGPAAHGAVKTLVTLPCL